jgi:hypothetical protein
MPRRAVSALLVQIAAVRGEVDTSKWRSEGEYRNGTRSRGGYRPARLISEAVRAAPAGRGRGGDDGRGHDESRALGSGTCVLYGAASGPVTTSIRASCSGRARSSFTAWPGGLSARWRRYRSRMADLFVVGTRPQIGGEWPLDGVGEALTSQGRTTGKLLSSGLEWRCAQRRCWFLGNHRHRAATPS